jgi:hypothetical protein
MQSQRLLRRVAAGTAVFAACVALATHQARADVSLEAGGAFSTSGGAGASGQAALSLGVIGAPIVPLTGELTVAVPFNGGYAATLDARLRLLSTTLGAGVGVGTIGATNRTSAIYDAILAQGVAPHTAIEARAYFGSSRPTTIFAGLRFSI